MIAKLTTGNGFAGAARYDLRINGNKAVPTEPQEVTILDIGGCIEHTLDDKGKISVDVKQLARDFRFQAMMRPAVRKPVYHWALSWKKGEHITDTEMKTRAKEFINAIGFNNTQYIIIRHEKDNEHCHILANIVDNEGNRISTEDLIDRAHFAARMITKIYGYSWGEPANEETINRAHNPREKVRYTIEPIINDAIKKATNIDQLPGLLNEHKISCTIKYSSEGQAVGITFSYLWEGQVHVFRGSSVDRKLSCKNILLKINNQRKKFYSTEMRKAYNGILPTIHEMMNVYHNTFQLYSNVKEEGITLREETNRKWQELQTNINQLKILTAALQEEKREAETIRAICTILMLMNPIAALLVMVLSSIISDINQSNIQKQRNQLVSHIETIRTDINNLEHQKATLIIKKQELLDRFLYAKNCYKEYRNGLNTNDIGFKELIIRNYVNSDQGLRLLLHVNNAFGTFDSHYHLVPGVLEKTDNGFRWVLFEDGYTTDNQTIFNQHEPAPQKNGRSYIDFAFNNKGELIATIEADKTNYYTKGVSGIVNLSQGTGDLRERTYNGFKEEHDKLTRHTIDTCGRKGYKKGSHHV